MKRKIIILIWLSLFIPVLMVQGEVERWQRILTTDFFIYSFDKLSLKTGAPEDAGTAKGDTLDVWLKYQYREPAIAELLAWAKQRNIPKEDLEDTENLDFLLVHTLLSKGTGKLELETIVYYKNGIPLTLAPASEQWQAIVPGSVNEYLFAKIWEYAAGKALFNKGIF